MAIFILNSLAYRITGDIAHEWIGVCVFALLVIHNIIHWSWYRRIFQGRYNFRRILNTIINIILLVTTATLIITGLLHSRTVLSFMHPSGGMLLRQIHTIAAYWCLLVISVHIGIHWEIIINHILKTIKKIGINHLPAIVTSCMVAIVLIYGVYSFLERDMPAKLFLGYSFDFWDENKNEISFFTENISIMAVYIFLTHHIIKWIEYLKIHKGE
ncbi:MAG: DUF4405 domain-containing protein [Deltaproteobacteria bacterium]|nr:DUF4405 domain-containing protein [Deltaproteobacteria bacterium]